MALFAIPAIPALTKTVISLSVAAATLLTSTSVNSSENSEILESNSAFEKFKNDASHCRSDTNCIAEVITQNPDAFTQDQHHWLFRWHYQKALQEAETEYDNFYSESEPLMLAHYRALGLGKFIEIHGLLGGIDEYLTYKSFFEKRIYLLSKYGENPSNPPRQNDMGQKPEKIEEIAPKKPEEKNYISMANW